MPHEQAAEDRIKQAESRGFESSEQAIAADLFPNLDAGERAMLVGLQVAKAENYPDDPDDEDGLTGFMKEMRGIDYWVEQIKKSGLLGRLDEVQRIIFRKRYGGGNWPD